MRKCTYCGQENDDTAVNCKGCGTSTIAESSESSPQAQSPEEARRTLGQKRMAGGGLLFLGGLAVTGYTYLGAASSPEGGTYVIAYGAIIAGIAQFFRGRALASGNDGD